MSRSTTWGDRLKPALFRGGCGSVDRANRLFPITWAAIIALHDRVLWLLCVTPRWPCPFPIGNPEVLFFDPIMQTMRSLLLSLALLCLGTPALATTCEESFDKKGDFFNGSAYFARVQVQGLSVERAFFQLRVILAREGIRTLSTDVANGTMRAENPATAFQRALPIDVFAFAENNQTTVEMVFTLPSGVTASRETVKKYICGALNQLEPPAPTP